MSIVKLNLDKFDYIYAYDPGGMTGFCKVYIDRARKVLRILEIAEFQTWDKLEEHIHSLNKENTLIVFESFTIRTMAVHLIPVEVIGVLRFLANKHGVLHFTQPPAAQGARGSDKVNGNRESPIVEKWYPQLKVFSSHHGSATRHAIFFCINNITNKTLWEIEFDYPKLKEKMLNR